ncbi:MAG: ATP synthase F1 subunit gamma [Candidatus Bipolaricaulota bacterium]|nr:ATP synthase F1 subunit gamma [Candidatus Bipolaricaulota bacterium]
MSARARAIKGRIKNVDNIRQITKAMNAIAMTKLTRMKRRLRMIQPWMGQLESCLAVLLAQAKEREISHPLTVDNGGDKVGIFVLNSDRGLCGRFKGELNWRAYDLMSELGGKRMIITGGEKARSFFVRHRADILQSYTNIYETPTAAVARQMATYLASLYRKGELGRVILVYMKFSSDLVQRTVTEELLPIKVKPVMQEAILEPNLSTLLDYTLSLYLESKLFSALVETKTSEHAIRRQAMKNATDNAEDMINTLTRRFNRARQQSITRELLDIMGGAEALQR